MTDGTKRPWTRGVVLAAGGVALVIIGLVLGLSLRAMGDGKVAGNESRRVLYWYDPMVPDQHFDKAGKSPFMDMALVPRYEGEPAAAPGIRIDPGVTQNLGVRIALVDRKAASVSITAPGIITFNERDVAILQAKQSGFVARSYGRALGDVVRAGDPLIDLRVPEWTGAIAEYLALRTGADKDLAASAQKRLAGLGVPEDAIREAETKGAAPSTFTIRAPTSGAIASLDVREGMSIATGSPLATIKGLSPVWLIASVPQGAAGRIRTGDKATARTPAYPGEQLTGRIESVLPSADAASRAVEVRVALPNPGGRLRPGMTAQVELTDAQTRDVLTAPTEAIIHTGARAIVITVLEDGRFAPVEIETGASFGDRTEILSGLTDGEKVVASGQFLIDSEASLSGVMARLQTKGPDGASLDFNSTGTVTAVDGAGVTLAHAPVARLNWPAMTMQFAWGKGGAKPDIKVGDAVRFSFRQADTGFVLTTIEHARATP